MEIESLARSRQVGLLRVGSLGRWRHIDLLGPLDWEIPKQEITQLWKTNHTTFHGQRM